MSDFTKYIEEFKKFTTTASGKKVIRPRKARIYSQNFPTRLTSEFKKFNIDLIKKGKVKKMYRKDNTKDEYAYNPTTKQAVRLVRNKDGTFKYKYMKDFKLLKNDTIIYKGETTQLNVETNSNILWSTNENMSTISVSPDSSTKYYIIICV